MTLSGYQIVKETEKAINIKYEYRFFWIPKSLITIQDNTIEVTDWFYKKEIKDSLPRASFYASLFGKTEDRGIPATLQTLGII